MPTGILRDSGAVRMSERSPILVIQGMGLGLSVPLNGVHLVQGKVCMAARPALS